MKTRAARDNCNCHVPDTTSFGSQDNHILTEYQRGTRYAAIALVCMFAFLTFGAVMLGW